MILKDKQSHIPWPVFRLSIDKLLDSAKKLDSAKIQLLLDHIIPTYRPRNFSSNLDSHDNISSRSIKAEA